MLIQSTPANPAENIRLLDDRSISRQEIRSEPGPAVKTAERGAFEMGRVDNAR